MEAAVQDRIPWRWRGWPWLVLFTGLAASLALGILLDGVEHDRHHDDLQARAAAIRQDVSQRLLRCDRLLDAAAVWAGGPARDDPAAWVGMASRLSVGQGDWCTDAVTWYPRVLGAERRQWIERGRALYGPQFDFRPAGERELHFPLMLAVPAGAASRRFLGLDPWADPRRRADIQRAIATDRLAATPVQRFTPTEYVVLRYVPVHAADGSLLGLLGAPLRLERLVQQIQRDWPTLRVTLSADDDAGREQRVSAPAPNSAAEDDDLPPVTGRIDSGGQVMEVEVQALQAFHTDGGLAMRLALPVAAAVLSLVAALLVGVLQRSGSRAQRLARRMSQEALRQRREALQAEAQRRLLVEMVPIGVIQIGTDHCIVNANKAAHELLGYRDGGLVGQHMSVLHDDAEVEQRCAELSRRLGRPVRPGLELFAGRKSENGLPVESEWTLVRADGSHFPAVLSSSRLQTAEGQLLGSVRVFTDISERHRAHEQMRFLALHDSLTGLANRTQLEQVGQHWLADDGAARGLALLLLDLNRFKQINDTLGHPVGDEVLRQVGQRLRDAVRPTDLVARMGGDEFVVLLQGVPDEAAALAAVAHLRPVFDADLEAAGAHLRISSSMGLALCPQHGRELPELLKAADLAMYRAKAQGSAQVVVYDPLQDAPDASRLRMERDLRLALAQGQFELHYQPVVAVADGRPMAVEALVRWNHPGFGLVPPAEFIPMAETTGDIVPLGAWVLETACAEMQALRAQWPQLRLAVNLSVRQLEVPGFEHQVAAVLQRSGLPPQALELEVTESLVAAAQGQVPQALEALHRMGVSIAVDDFGTGYSALQYLKNFPVDTLKIDRAFVRDLGDAAPPAGRRGALPLGLAIIAMARSLDLHTVAEGVETDAQWRQLAEAGCEWLQGYRFSHAVPAARLAATLEGLRPLVV